MSLSERARTGLRDMPSNAAWLLSRALKPAEAVGDAAESATAGARDRGREVTAAVLDAAPVRRRLGRHPDEARPRAGRTGAGSGGAGGRGRPGVQGALGPRTARERARPRAHDRGRPRDDAAGQAARHRGREGRQRGGAARPPGGRGGGRGAAPGRPGRGRRRARGRAARRRRGPRARRGARRRRDGEARRGPAAGRRGDRRRRARRPRRPTARRRSSPTRPSSRPATPRPAIEAAERLRKDDRDGREDHRAGAQARRRRTAGWTPTASRSWSSSRPSVGIEGPTHHDQGPARRRDREGVAHALNGGHAP